MGAILGLLDSEQLKGQWSNNARRRVFYQYPNGAAPLMGLLSLVDEDEDGETDKPEFGWREDRNEKFEYKTVQANSAGPFTTTSGSSGAVGVDLTAAGWTKAANQTIRVKVDRVDTIQERDVLEFRKVPTAGSKTASFQGIVTAVWSAHHTVDVLLQEAVGVADNLLNTTAANGLDVLMVGSATAEADRMRKGWWTLPIECYNYTQIFRHGFSFSRNALKEGLKFDSSGPYKTKAKKNSLKHFQAMEYAAMFSNRSVQLATTDDGETTQRRTLGGILWFLKQWELGNTSNGGKFDYRVNGSDLTGLDWNADDDKRILDFKGASVTKDEFENIIENAFRFTNDSSFEKLVLCGGGLLKAFNKFVDREGMRTMQLNPKEDTYGMNVTSWETPWGILHFKVHPLLNQTKVYRKSGFILDLGELKYTPFQDTDTTLLKNRQANDFDGRKDEWLTEFGLEVRFPENHMFLDNLGGITS